MLKTINPITGLSEEEERDVEEFFSRLFNIDFTFKDNLYRAEEELSSYKCLMAYPHYVKIQNDFYRLEKAIVGENYFQFQRDADSLLLLPLDKKRLKVVNETEHTIQLTERTNETTSKEWSKAINLTLEWTLFKGAKHPERIEEYKNSYMKKISALQNEKIQLERRISEEYRKITMLTDFQENIATKEEQSI